MWNRGFTVRKHEVHIKNGRQRFILIIMGRWDKAWHQTWYIHILFVLFIHHSYQKSEMMGTLHGPEFCSCLTLFHIESFGFLDSSPTSYETWNLRYHIYISRNNHGSNITEQPLLQLKAVHSCWCVNEDTGWFCLHMVLSCLCCRC